MYMNSLKMVNNFLILSLVFIKLLKIDAKSVYFDLEAENVPSSSYKGSLSNPYIDLQDFLIDYLNNSMYFNIVEINLYFNENNGLLSYTCPFEFNIESNASIQWNIMPYPNSTFLVSLIIQSQWIIGKGVKITWKNIKLIIEKHFIISNENIMFFINSLVFVNGTEAGFYIEDNSNLVMIKSNITTLMEENYIYKTIILVKNGSNLTIIHSYLRFDDITDCGFIHSDSKSVVFLIKLHIYDSFFRNLNDSFIIAEGSLMIMNSSFYNITMINASLITMSSPINYIINTAFLYINYTMKPLICIIFTIENSFSLFKSLDFEGIINNSSSIINAYSLIYDKDFGGVVRNSSFFMIDIILSYSSVNICINLSKLTYFFIKNLIFWGLINTIAIALRDIQISHIYNTTVGFSYSEKGAIGVIITDSFDPISITYVYFRNYNCFSNELIYSLTNEVGVAMYINTDKTFIYLNNCIFLNNSIRSQGMINVKYGGPCINSLSLSNNIYIYDSLFINNTAKFYSNCIYFLGTWLIIMRSTFKNNNPIIDAEDYELFLNYNTIFFNIVEVMTNTFGGVVYSQPECLIINQSNFFNSSAYIGGALYVNGDVFNAKIWISITNCIFTSNSASWGGALFIGSDMVYLYALVKNSFFLSNHAKQSGCIMISYTSKRCVTVVRDSYFNLNYAEQGGVAIFINLNSFVLMMNNIFFENNTPQVKGKTSAYMGGVFGSAGDTTTKMYFYGNKFFSNWAFIGAGVGGIFSGKYIAAKEFYFNSSAGTKGGSLIIQEFGTFIFCNSIIINTTSGFRSGLADVVEFSKALFINITVINSSTNSLGGVFFVMDDSNLTVINCSFLNGFSKTGGFIATQVNFRGVIKFNSCQIIRFQGEGYMIDLSNGFIMVENIFIENLTTGIIYMHEGQGFFIDCAINNHIYVNWNNLVYLDQSNLRISHSIMKNISGYFDIENSYLTIEETIIKGVLNEIQGNDASFIKLYNSNISAINVGFSGLLNCGGISSYFSQIYMNSIIFNGSQEVAFGSIGLVSLYESNGSLMNVKFIGGYANSGGGINIYCPLADLDINRQVISESYIYISNSHFLMNYANQGGGVWGYNYRVYIENSSFIQNKAIDGGGVYYMTSSENINDLNITLKYCNFTMNTALNGGAIRWLYSQPLLKNCIYINNTAVYGINIAAYPIRLFLQIYQKGTGILLYDSQKNVTLSFFEASGQKLTIDLILRYVDVYNQTVTTLPSSLETFTILTENDYKKLYPINNATKPFIIGQVAVLNSGSMNYSLLTIYATPNSQLYLLLNPSQITLYSKFIQIPHPILENYLYTSESQYMIIIPIKLRRCKPGEILNNATQACIECGPGFYSLSSTDISCNNCPLNSECLGGNDIYLHEGYWRSSRNTTIIHHCDQAEGNCLGTEDSLCSIGFYGPLCFSCKPGYSRVTSNLCADCLNQILSILRICLVIAMISVILIMLIKSSLQNMKTVSNLLVNKEKLDERDIWKFMDFQNIYMKILINNFQMIGVLTQIQMVWPDFLTSFFDFLLYFSSVSSKLMAIECVYAETNEYIPVVYMKLLSLNVIPLLLMLMVTLYWKIYQRILHLKKINEKVYTTIIGIFVMMQPTILSENTLAMNCMELDPGQSVLTSNPIDSCDSEYHKQFVYYLAIPSFLLWSTLIPLMIFCYLMRKRKELYTGKVFGKFNFFYIGYQMKYFYWDFVIMFRKIMLIILLTFSSLPIYTKMYLILFIFTFGFYYQMKHKPFALQIFNRLEMWSYLSGLFSIFLTFIIIASDNDSVDAIMYLIIILINSTFLGYWTLNYGLYSLKIYTKYFKAYFPKTFDRMLHYWEKTSNRITPMLSRHPYLRRLVTRNIESKVSNQTSLTHKISPILNNNFIDDKKVKFRNDEDHLNGSKILDTPNFKDVVYESV